MDFLSQAATAAKRKVALVNAVGFLMASKHTYLHYAPFALLLHSFCVLQHSRKSTVVYLQYYIYFYVTKPTQMLVNELPVDCMSVACTSCRIGSGVPNGVYCQNIQCKKLQFTEYCLSVSP